MRLMWLTSGKIVLSDMRPNALSMYPQCKQMPIEKATSMSKQEAISCKQMHIEKVSIMTTHVYNDRCCLTH